MVFMKPAVGFRRFPLLFLILRFYLYLYLFFKAFTTGWTWHFFSYGIIIEDFFLFPSKNSGT